MNKLKTKKKIIIGFLFVILLSLVVFAATYYRVANDGNPDEIDEFNICMNVVNNCAADLFVPTATSTEWSKFRTYYPSGCSTVIVCAECSTSGDCASVYPDCNPLVMDCVSSDCCLTEGGDHGDCPPPCEG